MSAPSPELVGSVRRGWFGRMVPARKADAALLGALVPAGWLLHDLVVFTSRGDPSACLELLPGSAAAVGLGMVTGFLLGSCPFLLLPLVLLSVAGSLAPLALDLPVSRTQLWLPRVVFIGSVTFAAAAFVQRRWSPGLIRLGLTGGFLACLAKSVLLYGMDLRSRPLLFFGLAVLALGFLRQPLVRRLATLACIAIPLFGPRLPAPGFRPLVKAALHRARATRPDLPPPAVPAHDGPNLLLIVLDTVRADRLAPYGYERVTTPGLDAFVAEHATIYTESRSTSSWTLPAHASLFTGLLPSEHAATHTRVADEAAVALTARSAQPLRPEFTTIAERLRSKGYWTCAIVANSAYLSHPFGLDQGFQHYDDRPALYVNQYLALAQLGGIEREVGHVAYRDARTITDLAVSWLEDLDPGARFFLMLNYMDAHEPYVLREELEGALSGEPPTDPLNPPRFMWPAMYDLALLYLDEHLTRLLQVFVERGHMEDTAVVVTSDHGQSLGEHEFYGHAWTLYEDVLRVPLYVKPAGGRSAAVDERVVDSAGAHDLMLELVGLEPEALDEGRPKGWMAELFAGKPNADILDWGERTGWDVRTDHLAWGADGHKWIVSAKGGVRAYDLGQDPNELAPLAISEDERLEALATARAWWERHSRREAVALEVSEVLRGQLEALGYGD